MQKKEKTKDKAYEKDKRYEDLEECFKNVTRTYKKVKGRVRQDNK